MKRHLFVYSALFAGVAGSALAGGHGAAPYGAAPYGTVHAAPAPAPHGQPILVNGRSVYDDRGAVAAGGAVWGGAAAGAAYGAPVVERQVVSEELYLQQRQVGATAHAWPMHEAPAQVVGHGAPGPIIQQTTTQQDLVAVASVQPTLVQSRGGWGPRVFVGAQGGFAFSGALRTDDRKVQIDKGYNFGAHAGVKFGGGWRAKVEYVRIAGKISRDDYDYDDGGHGGGKPKPCMPACGGKAGGGYGGGGHGGGGGEGGGYGSSETGYRANAGFVTVEKGFAVSKTFEPYVGLGVGYLKPHLSGDSASIDGGYAVKASVGASVALSQNLEAYGEYAYVLAPDLKGDDGAGERFTVDYDTHLLSAGVRITFN